MTHDEREFKYPFDFRLLHQWMIYAMLVFGPVISMVLYFSHADHRVLPPPPVLVLRWLGVLAFVVLAEYVVLRRVPTAIRVSHQRVTLVRFRPYAEFDVTDIQSVEKSVPWLFGRWTKVMLRRDVGVGSFLLSPEAEWHDELLRLLGQSQAIEHTLGPKTYSWSFGPVWVARIAVAISGLMFVLMLLGPAIDPDRRTIGGIVFSALGALAIWYLLWRPQARTPIRVEFDDRITFATLTGGRIVVDKSDIVAVKRCRILGRFGAPGSKGTTVILRDRRRLHIQTFFIDYRELTNRLESLARPDREH